MTGSSLVLVANGPLVWTPTLRDVVVQAAMVVAADGGANHLLELDVRPRAVIGDLDSLSTATRRWVGADRIVHRPDQDRTDLDKALEWAFDEQHCAAVTVLGALGGRIDHALANLGLLVRYARSVELTFRDSDRWVAAVSGRADLPSHAGETWSFMTFDPRVRVSLEGVRWPVHHADLSPHTAPSISNLATGDQVSIETSGGAVLAFRTVTPSAP